MKTENDSDDAFKMIERSVSNHMESEDMELSSLLSKREHYYAALTGNIIKLFAPRLTSALQFQLQIDRTIHWKSVEVSPIANFVTVMGFVDTRIGDIVATEEGPMEITEENSKKYNRVVRVTLPVKLLQSGTSVEIFNYLKTLTSIAAGLSADELEKLLSDPNFSGEDSLYNNPEFAGYLDKITRPQDVFGFDGSQLSDEQIRSLSMFHSRHTGAKN